MNMQSPRVHHTLKIVGLALVTLALATVVGFLFPKFSNAPGENVITPSQPLVDNASIIFENLKSNDRVKAKQVIEGKVSGYWFFEASFPVTLRDINGTPFATVIATTDEDWMVSQHVSFHVTMPDTFSYTGVGSILFKKDDPSDGEAPFDPEKDQKIIPVIFENE